MNSEWKVDETGRRYRQYGNCREYEPDFIFAYQKTDKDKEEAKKAFEQEIALHTGRKCPLRTGLDTECMKNCSLYGNDECVIASREATPGKDPRGKYCPIFKGVCREDCALYKDGCSIRNLVNIIYERKEG